MRSKFFRSGHGKCEHDGVGAVIKRALTHEQLKVDGVHMNSAAHVTDEQLEDREMGKLMR